MLPTTYLLTLNDEPQDLFLVLQLFFWNVERTINRLDYMKYLKCLSCFTPQLRHII